MIYFSFCDNICMSSLNMLSNWNTPNSKCLKLCLQAVLLKCSVSRVSWSLCRVRITMKITHRSLSCRCSGGVHTTSCCVTTSNTRLSRTAPPATASPTPAAASHSPSNRSRWRILGLTYVLWVHETSSPTTALSWSGCQVRQTGVWWRSNGLRDWTNWMCWFL